MMSNQDANNHRRPFGLFWLWFISNSFMWLTAHSLVGYINLYLYGRQNTGGLVGFVSGIVAGLFIGLIQWAILSKNFAISPLWILSCMLGFPLYYTINWYTGIIAMGAFQQFLIRRKVNDSFRWFTVLYAGVGICHVLADAASSPLFICFMIIFGAIIAYGLPQGILLVWYKQNLNPNQQVTPKPESP